MKELKRLNPTVRFTDCVADSDSQYEEGMMGKVISAELDANSDCVIFIIAEDRYAEFNKKQENLFGMKAHIQITV